MVKTHLALAVVAASLAVVSTSQAALYDPGYPGTVQTDQWVTLGTNGGWASAGFGTGDLWTLDSNVGGDATIKKLSGFAQIATGSVYYNFGSDPFDFTSANTELVVGDATAVAGVTKVLLQLEIGDNGTSLFFNGVLPKLSYDGGSQAIAGTVLRQEAVGTIPFGIFTGTKADYAIEYDVTGLGVTSFGIDWTGVNHVTLYNVRLDQTNAAVVPEPSALALLALPALALRRSRR